MINHSFARALGASVLAVALLGGCALMQDPPAVAQLYVLPDTLGGGGGQAIQATVKIAPIHVASGLDTARIAVKNKGSKLDYFADAAWPTALPDMLQDRFVKDLGLSSIVRGVVGSDSNVQADYILKIDVQNFEAIQPADESAPMSVTINYRATLAEARSRKLIATLLGQSTVEAKDRTMEATIAAFGAAQAEASSRLFDQLWGSLTKEKSGP